MTLVPPGHAVHSGGSVLNLRSYNANRAPLGLCTLYSIPKCELTKFSNGVSRYTEPNTVKSPKISSAYFNF